MEEPGLERLVVEVYAPPTEAVQQQRSRNGRSRVALVLATVVALVATGFGVSQIAGDDGAESPEAAVEALLLAINQEDAMGVMESLAPSERDVLVPSVEAMADELTRVEIVDADLDLGAVQGVDIEIEGYELRTQGLHHDVASVLITGGTMKASADFRRLPLGNALTTALEEVGGHDLDERADESSDIEEARLATVRSDGGWHVSLLYSLAELERVDSGGAVPDFGNEIPARGADSPEGAVEAMVAAFNDEDFTRMIELTAPDTMAVLHDYGSNWIEAESEDEDDEDTWTLEMELGEPSGSVNERTVPVTSLRWEHFWEGESNLVVTYDGKCITSEYEWDDEPGVSDEESSSSCEEGAGESLFGGGMGLGFFGGGSFGAPGSFGVTVVQRGGAWYVDPARTVLDTMIAGLEAISVEDARRAAEFWALVTSEDGDYAYWAFAGPEFYEECPGVEPPAEDATFAERKEAGEACEEEAGYGDYESDEAFIEPDEDAEVIDEFDTFDEHGEPVDEFGDPMDPDGEEASPVPDPWPSDKCYGLPERSDIEACLQELVETGEIDEEELHHYRCDAVYDDLYESDEEISDDRFAAADEAYERCIKDGTVPGAQPEPGTDPQTTAPDNGTAGKDPATTTTTP